MQSVASIHFPLAREDIDRQTELFMTVASIHFPLAREDGVSQFTFVVSMSLQSTSLLRGKTKYTDPVDAGADCFNPLPSCEGRLEFVLDNPAVLMASIHFPLAREDPCDR